MTIDAGNDPLAEIIRAAGNLFPEFAFLGPSGVLDLVGPFEAVDRIRFELSNGECLHLQGVGVQVVGQEGDDGAFVHSVASVTASDWYNKYATSHDSRAFFDVDHPRGTQVHTSTENEVAWVEISFARPLDVASLRLRNVAQATTSNRARDLRVLTSSGGDWRLRFDGTARGRDLEDLVKSAAEHTPAAAGLGPLLQVAALTILGDYPRARVAFDAIEITPDVKGHFYAVMNREVLAERSLEWTAHGPRRSFRFWTEAEKFRYTDMTAQVAAQLKELTPNVCLGFGAALAVVRDGDLIPHDDDLDIIIAFEPDEAATLPQALRLIEEFLRPRGFVVRGNYIAHRHVLRPGGKHVDVFAGIFEGDTISWYPGTRGSLDRSTMFPTSSGVLQGVSVPLPRSPLIYLETVYGSGWRHPDPQFTHTWNKAGYADLTKPSAARPR